MTIGIGHWARARLAEHRAIAEYRQAWRRLRRLHADTSGSRPDSATHTRNHRPPETETGQVRPSDTNRTVTQHIVIGECDNEP